jgi:peroxiredoxin (alkyl hydroperoxide reductase subunit C)
MKRLAAVALFFALSALAAPSPAQSPSFQESIFPVGQLKPVDSTLAVKVGETAPDFTLPSISGEKVRLSAFRGVKNVVLTFVPAAWTPVCSGQWPGYAIVEDVFDKYDATLIGITVDNIPTLYSWVKQMGGLWFPVASDFWPHGAVAKSYGLLRSDGVSERALVLIDKTGTIRYIDVHDINTRPDLGVLIQEMEKLKK